MLFGSRTGFGLEFHVERDPSLLCVDIFVGGLHVDTWDNAFYPPLLVKKLGDELARFREPRPPADGFTTPAESYLAAEEQARTGPEGELARCEFLEWGECTDQVMAFAFPDGDVVHIACRVRDGGGPAWGTGARDAPTVATVSRADLVEALEGALDLASREWAVRLTALRNRR